MRQITEKEKRGFAAAIRTFLRPLCPRRISQQAGDRYVRSLNEAGLTMDEVLNIGNYRRARAAAGDTDIDTETYIAFLTNQENWNTGLVKGIKAEGLTYEELYGQLAETVNEPVHDFYLEVTGRGGKFDNDTVKQALCQAVSEAGLTVLMSEGLIARVTAALKAEKGILASDDTVTYYEFLNALTRKKNPVPYTVAPPAGESLPSAEIPPSAEEQPDDDGLVADLPDDFSGGFTEMTVRETPEQFKRKSLQMCLENYTPGEIQSLMENSSIENADQLSLGMITDLLTEGSFDPAGESARAKEMHMKISSDLIPAFIQCVCMQGIEMNEQMAETYDVLHINWDLRDSRTRTLYKLKGLVYSYAEGDEDLMGLLRQLEKGGN